MAAFSFFFWPPYSGFWLLELSYFFGGFIAASYRFI
jgi:hypothetical protein